MNPSPAIDWLLTKLSASVNLDDLGGRIYPMRAPEGTALPCLVWQMMEAPHTDTVDHGPERVGSVAIQLRTYSDRALTSHQLRETLRRTLQGVIVETFSHDGEDYRIDGTNLTDFYDTYEDATETYGALCVCHVHITNPSNQAL